MKQTWLYIAGAAVLYYLLMQKKKTGLRAPSAQAAASTARQLVADAVDQTTFLPDETTFADQYAKDKNMCR
jgi:threonine/homoserine/homoserine lactone efflux protein